MENPLEVLVLVAAIVVVGHAAVERIAPTFASVTSAFAILVGLALAPAIDPNGLYAQAVAPVAVLGLTGVGFMVGLEAAGECANGRWLARVSGVMMLTEVVFLLLGTWLLIGAYQPAGIPILPTILALTCLGLAGGADTLRRTPPLGRPETLEATQTVARLHEVAAIGLAGVAFALQAGGGGSEFLSPSGQYAVSVDLRPIEWVLLAACLGLAVGYLTVLIVRARAQRFEGPALVGLLGCAGALAASHGLSPLLVALIVGMVVGWFGESVWSPHARARIERPLQLIIIVIAAALWRWPDAWVWTVALGATLLQVLAKVAAGSAVVYGQRRLLVWSRGPGVFWLGTGGVGLALAVVWSLLGGGVVANLLLTTALLIAVANEVILVVYTSRLSRLVGLSEDVGPAEGLTPSPSAAADDHDDNDELADSEAGDEPEDKTSKFDHIETESTPDQKEPPTGSPDGDNPCEGEDEI